MHAGMAKAEDIGGNGNSPVEERPPVQWRTMGEVGHGIKPESLQVNHSAFGEHHVIPGIAVAAEDDIVTFED